VTTLKATRSGAMDPPLLLIRREFAGPDPADDALHRARPVRFERLIEVTVLRAGLGFDDDVDGCLGELSGEGFARGT